MIESLINPSQNIAKAKKEVERLDTEEPSTTNGSSTPATNGHGHGETKATAGVEDGGLISNEVDLLKKAVEDVTADLKGESLEEKA